MNSERPRIAAATEWTFLVLVLSLAFMRPNTAFLGSTVVMTDLAFPACVLVFAAAIAFRQSSFRFDPVYVWFGIYAFALVLSAAFSIDTARSVRRLPAEIYLIALAVLAINVVRDERMLMRTLIAWLAASAAAASVSAFAVVSFFAGWENALATFAMHHYGTLPPGNYPRVQGTFEYPAMLCNYLTVGLMVLLAFRREGRMRSTTTVLLALLFVIAIFFTLTPGIGGVLAVIALWIYLCKRQDCGVVGKLALAGMAVLLAALVIVSSLTPFGTAGPVYLSLGGYDITPTARLLSWQQAWAAFADDPLFGRGLGLPVVNLPYQLPGGGWSLITDAHNVALNVAAQAGLFGVGALAAVVAAVLRRSGLLSLECSGVNAIRLAMGVAFVSCLVIQGIAGSFENARHLWVLMGLMIAADRITRTPPQTEGPRA